MTRAINAGVFQDQSLSSHSSYSPGMRRYRDMFFEQPGDEADMNNTEANFQQFGI